MNDPETLKSTIVLIAALIGLTAAVISFLNARLSEAKTPEHRQLVLKMAAIIFDGILFICGAILIQNKALSGFGAAMLVLSALTSAGLFSTETPKNMRTGVITLVLRFSSVVFLVLAQMISSLSDRVMHQVEAQKRTADALNKLSQ